MEKFVLTKQGLARIMEHTGETEAQVRFAAAAAGMEVED